MSTTKKTSKKTTRKTTKKAAAKRTPAATSTTTTTGTTQKDGPKGRGEAVRRVRAMTRDTIVGQLYSASAVNSVSRCFGLTRAEAEAVITEVCGPILEDLKQ